MRNTMHELYLYSMLVVEISLARRLIVMLQNCLGSVNQRGEGMAANAPSDSVLILSFDGHD